MKKKMMIAAAATAISMTALAGNYTYAATKKDASVQVSVKQNKLAKQVDQFLKENKFNGSILLVKGGKTIVKKGYGFRNYKTKAKNNYDTIFRIGSVTKTFTSTAVMQLVEKGKLKLDDPVKKYIPDLPYGNITIEHLLTHSSGLPEYYTDEIAKDPKLNKKYLTNEEVVEQVKKMKLMFEPGTDASYSNSGFALLSYIIERAAHTTWENYVNEYFFKPLDMDRTGVDINQPILPNHSVQHGWTYGNVDISYAGAAGAIYSTIGDLHKFDDALLSGKLISKHSLKKMFTPGIKGYGLGWVDGKNLKLSSDWRWHNGHIPGWHTYNGVNQKKDTQLIMMSNYDNPKNEYEVELMAMKLTELIETGKIKK